MTKAAVKNMLRLMENAEPGEAGSAELDQYAEFIQQQGEIVLCGDDSHNAANDSSPRANNGEHNDEASADALQKQEAASDFGGVAVSLASSSTLLATVAATTPEVPVGVDDAPTTHGTPTIVPDRSGGVVAGTHAATRQQHPGGLNSLNSARSAQGVVPLLVDTEASAQVAVTDDAATTSAVATTSLLDAATNALPVPTEDNLAAEAVATAVAGSTAEYSTTALPTASQGNNADEAASEHASSPSAPTSSVNARADASLAPATVGPESTPGNGQYITAAQFLPSSPRVLSLFDVAASTAGAVTPPPPPPAGGGPASSTPHPNGTSQPCGGGGGNGDDIGATTAAPLATEVVAGGEEACMTRTPLPSASAAAAAAAVAVTSDANLSAKERLLRHVRVAKSPRSGSDDDCESSISSSSNGGRGNDNDTAENDGGGGNSCQATSTEVVQVEGAMTPAQELDCEDGRKGDSTTAGGEDNDDDVAIVVASTPEVGEGTACTETNIGRAGSRPETTRPGKQQQGGGRGEGGNNSGGESGASPAPSATNTLTSAEKPGSITVRADGDGASSIAPTKIDHVHQDESAVGVTAAPETARMGFNDITATDIGGGNDGNGIGPGQSGDALTQGVNMSVSPGATTEAACDSVVVNGAESGGSLGKLEKAGLSTTNDDSKGTNSNLPASEVPTAPARPDTTNNQNVNMVKRSSGGATAEAGVTAETVPDKATEVESDRSLAATGHSNESNYIVSGITEKAIGGAKGGEETKIKAGSDGDSNEKQDGGDEQTASVDPTLAEPDWIEGYDPGHDCYYYHHVPTGESRWYKPDEPYEPYVHSDEDPEEDGSALGSENGDRDRRRDKKRKNDGNRDNKHHRNKRGELEEEGVEVNTRSPSGKHRGSSKAARRRSSKSRTAPVGSQRRRRDDDNNNDDNGKHVSRSSSSRSPSLSSVASVERRSQRERGGGGRRRSNENSRQQHGKTALERLNDLTDEAGDLRSDDGSRKPVGSGRRDSRGSRRRNGDGDEDGHHRSSRRRSSGGGGGEDGENRHGKARRDSSSRKNGYHDGHVEDARRRSPQRSSSSRYSRRLLSPDGSNSDGGKYDDLKRETSSARRSSKHGHGGSKSRRSSKHGRDSQRES